MPNGSRKLVRTNFADINRIFPLRYYINLVFLLSWKMSKNFIARFTSIDNFKIIKYYISCLRLLLIKLDTLKDRYRNINYKRSCRKTILIRRETQREYLMYNLKINILKISI